MTRKRKLAAIAAGILGFVILAFPTTELYFLGNVDSPAPTSATVILWIFIGIYVLFGVLLGLGIARKSRQWIFTAILLLMAIVAFWSVLFIFDI